MRKVYIKNSSGELLDITEKDHLEQIKKLEEMRENGIQCNIQIIVEADGYIPLSELFILANGMNRDILNDLLNKPSKYVL